MKIYKHQPPDDVLIDYAFGKYQDAGRIVFLGARVGLPNGEYDAPMRTVNHFDRPDGLHYTFSSEHLWKLMQVDQANYERLLPADALREYVDA